MDTLTISDLVGSSQYEAVADDSLKDEDNVAWVMVLEPPIRDEWIERISWIRLVDRLAENELFVSNSSEFQKVYIGWQRLLHQGRVEPDCAHREVLTGIRNRWFGQPSTGSDRLPIQAWARFLEATARYHQPHLVIERFADHQKMLEELSGSCFQTLPFLTEKYWQSTCAFGALDQFFNNLRDMREDAQQGICYLPTELLNHFGVSRDKILNLVACQNPNYARMMRFWLDDYLPTFRQKVDELLIADDLHPSWRIWRDWSFYRYHRIERVFRRCNFDYVQFPAVYWAEVRRDLPLLLSQVCREHCPAPITTSHQSLQSEEEFAVPSILLEISDKAVRVVEMVLSLFQWQTGDRIGLSEA